jgi:hypothetical protein
MIFDEKKIKSLGDIGEKIVGNYFSRKGCIVEDAINPFDSRMDMKVDGQWVEVKTQQPHVKMEALTFQPSQLRKCRNKNTRLMFVTAESTYSPKYKWNNCLFEVDSNFEYFEYTTSENVKMIGIKIDQPAVRFIKKLEEDEIQELRKFAQSNYKNGKRKFY